MTTALQVTNIQHATPEQAAQFLTSVPVFKLQQPTTEVEMAQAQQIISCLSKPAPRSWIASRVYATLAHYFTPDHEADVVKMIADDWAEILGPYPAWAISNACKWWLGRENEHHHRKPLPGDIQDRAHKEMEAIRAAKVVMAKGIDVRRSQPKDDYFPPRLSESQQEQRRKEAEAILAKAGFRNVMRDVE